MPESTESKKAKSSGRPGGTIPPSTIPPGKAPRNPGASPVFLRPRLSALCLMFLSAGLLGAGLMRGELALTLSGAAFAAVLVYSLAGVLCLVLLYREKTALSSLVPAQLEPGKSAEIQFSGSLSAGKRAFVLPGIVVRYELRLETKDKRQIRHIFNPHKTIPPLQALYRGAYYGSFDLLSVSDIPGFFTAGLGRRQKDGPRLLVTPGTGTVLPVSVQPGGERERVEPSWVRTDDLTDHRPYVPGDDPRRINWKLYGHGGELFVREGEREPPPRSKMVILVDTEADPGLFKGEAGRRMIDRCCEYALALALDWEEQGIEVSIGFNGPGPAAAEPPGAGQKEPPFPHAALSRTPAGPAALLAYPAASERGEPFPAVEGEGAVIFLLPRNYPGPLDELLSRRKTGRYGTELVFLYEDEDQREAAELCVRRYGQRRDCHVRCFPA